MLLENIDCMELMARYPDKYFDLAISDPPYGIDVANINFGARKVKNKSCDNKDWDNEIPTPEYFAELKRVSKEQIIWGANYFNCFNGNRGAIVWDKIQPLPTSSQCEIASYSRVKKVYKYTQCWTNFVNTKSSNHPTEKPVDLYKWIFLNLAKKGDKILDTHLGSGSIAIAVDSVNKIEKMNITLTASEIDTNYFNETMKRIKYETAQISLF